MLPGRDGGQHLPGGHLQRVVPRRDRAHDADRLAPDRAGVVAGVLGAWPCRRGVVRRRRRTRCCRRCPARRTRGPAGSACRPAGSRACASSSARSSSSRAAFSSTVERSTGVARLRFLEGGGCRGDRGVDVVVPRERDRLDRLVGARVDHVEGLARAGVAPLAADVLVHGREHTGRPWVPESAVLGAHRCGIRGGRASRHPVSVGSRPSDGSGAEARRRREGPGGGSSRGVRSQEQFAGSGGSRRLRVVRGPDPATCP